MLQFKVSSLINMSFHQSSASLYGTLSRSKSCSTLNARLPDRLCSFWEVIPANLSEFQFYRFIDYYHQRDLKHNIPINLAGHNSQMTVVLDGQQRLTALNLRLKGWYAEKLPYFRRDSDYAFPEKRLYIKVLGLSEDEIEFKFEIKILHDKDVESNDGNKHWFHIGEMLNFKEYQDTFDNCIEHTLVSDGNKSPSRTLGELCRAVHEKPLFHYFLEEE